MTCNIRNKTKSYIQLTPANLDLPDLAFVFVRGKCVRVALQPEGRDINKVTVQLDSRCIHSTAAYKADGDTSDLKKGGKRAK